VLIRTPLRIGSATVWADPRSGTVRFSALNRTRTLLAGLDPTSYLVARDNCTIVAAVGSPAALSFSIDRGASAAVSTSLKPSWCSAVEAALPEPLDETRGWLEVGVRVHLSSWYCAIPLGQLPRLQTRLARQGHSLTYIARIKVSDYD
jgi:hypothetical protein